MQVIEYLQIQSRRTIIALGLGLVLLIGTVDYLTGSEISFSVFYLIPIAIVTWFVHGRAGVIFAVGSAVIWLIADLSGDRVYSSPTIPFWNATVRMSFFLIVTTTLSIMREAQLHREELAHFVVHDLRSPLSNIVSSLLFLEEMIDDIDPESAEPRRQLVAMSLASGNRMLTLINSLLDLAKLESGKMELKQQQTNVQKVFEIAQQQVSAMAARNDVNINCEIGEGAEVFWGDAEVTIRVVVNLTSNAIKYSPDNSTVLIRAAPYGQNMIAISVIDKGPGIPPEWKKRIFEKFSQVEGRKAGLLVGSGLGLSFCRLAVEAQGGRIWLESELKKGTTFIFTLPINAPPTAQPLAQGEVASSSA